MHLFVGTSCGGGWCSVCLFSVHLGSSTQNSPGAHLSPSQSILVHLLCLPPPLGPGGGHMTQASQMRPLSPLVDVTGSEVAPDPSLLELWRKPLPLLGLLDGWDVGLEQQVGVLLKCPKHVSGSRASRGKTDPVHPKAFRHCQTSQLLEPRHSLKNFFWPKLDLVGILHFAVKSLLWLKQKLWL